MDTSILPLCLTFQSKMGNVTSRPEFPVILEATNRWLQQKHQRNVSSGRTGGRERGNRHRNRGYALREVEFLRDSEFAKHFRMTRAGFEQLLVLVEPFLHDTDERMAQISSGFMVTKRTKLYTTLRWLAGGSYIDICFGWALSEAAFYSTVPEKGVVWPVIEAIDQAFEIGLPMHDEVALTKLADEFATFSGGELYGCVTAIDGWVARTRKPFHKEVDDVMAYRNRHGCWGLVVLAGCDARCRFTMFSCKNCGSTNDTVAWELSEMKHLLEQGRLPNRFFLIGDEAFTCTNVLLVPYSGRGLGAWKDSFNYHLSVMRQCIERVLSVDPIMH
jgi:hypothetical protein